MRIVAQRVTRAEVTVDGQTAGAIGPGLVLLLGVGRADTESSVDYLVEKVLGLRVFEDEQNQMNRSIMETGGSLLVISQFTLYGDVRKGRRPSFSDAAPPGKAKVLYELFVGRARSRGIRVETGIFQADMRVDLTNSGPVTIMIDSEKLF